MGKWLTAGGVACAVFSFAILAAVAIAGTRHSGTVLSVSPDHLVVDELGVLGKERQVTVRLGAETNIAVSTRNQNPEDLEHPFVTKTITAAEINPGDYVVID